MQRHTRLRPELLHVSEEEAIPGLSMELDEGSISAAGLEPSMEVDEEQPGVIDDSEHSEIEVCGLSRYHLILLLANIALGYAFGN